MTNITLLRKIMIALLAVSTVIVVGMILKNSIENGATEPAESLTEEEVGEATVPGPENTGPLGPALLPTEKPDTNKEE